ncbi:MAG: hypothetical protein ACI4EO_03295 [Blautia sp.]
MNRSMEMLAEENRQLKEENKKLREACRVQKNTISRLWEAYLNAERVIPHFKCAEH